MVTKYGKRVALWVALLCGTCPALLAQDDRAQPELPPLSAEEQALADELLKTLEEGTEGRAMLDAILSGSQMGPTEGWFGPAKPQSKYDWASVSQQFDANQDGAVARDEFPGTDEDFAIVDRNGDSRITAEDDKWEASRGGPDFGRLLGRLDTDRNGEISRQDYEALWEKLSEGSDTISAEQLREKLFPLEAMMDNSTGGPSRGMLLMGLARQEIGSWNPGPMLGDQAIDFELKTVDGESVKLSDHFGEKPVVLIFGNYTCGPFRGQAGNLLSIYERFKDRATFLMVYVREAHPEDGWKLPSNTRNEVAIFQPQSLEERRVVAEVCDKHFHSDIPMMVDTIDDEVGHAYSGGPARMYVFDTEGQIVYKGGRGPHYFFPSQMESALVWLLNTPK